MMRVQKRVPDGINGIIRPTAPQYQVARRSRQSGLLIGINLSEDLATGVLYA